MTTGECSKTIVGAKPPLFLKPLFKLESLRFVLRGSNMQACSNFKLSIRTSTVPAVTPSAQILVAGSLVLLYWNLFRA